MDIRRWSADGLAYLTLNADVKDELVENLPALKSLFSLCQCQDTNVIYSVATIFVNMTNTYDVRKHDKEMAELATYAKQHVPKEHPKVKRKNLLFFNRNFLFEQDAQDFVDERRRKLVDAGVIPVLVSICKTKSENCREQIAR